MTHRSIVIALVALAPWLAIAQPAPSSDAAETAYKEGRRHYDLREWDQAIAKFKEAYELRSDAASLFNIAQAYRLKGDCVEALGFYKTYKRNFPSAQNLDKVDKFIAELEPCAKQQSASAKTEPIAPAGAETPAPRVDVSKSAEPATSGADTGGGKRTTGLVVAGVGAGAVVAGTVFGLIARSKASAVSNGGNPAMPPVFDPSTQNAGKHDAVAATILWTVGGAAIVTGGVVWLLGHRAEHASVAVVPRERGAVVVWQLAR
jgi:hypothetical protein